MSQGDAGADPRPGGTISELVSALARSQPDAVAIAAPGRSPLSCAGLADQLASAVRSLRAASVGVADGVAIVLPNGPEMATAFLAVASGAVAAPLNPAYTASEFEFYLSDLAPKALVVSDAASPAVAVARKLGIRVLTLATPAGAPAGTFTLDVAGGAPSGAPDFSGPDDVALVLHTSGTTSRPKIVPLLHRNLCASAAHIAEGLALTADDRCLNVMPLFHIHGLVGALLSTLRAGGSLVCTGGFDAARFPGWLEEHRPTWYSAVPTVHQAVLAQARGKGRRETSLRFIRSCSSPLPPPVMAELEEAFGVPVVEAYGMTEASHQMSSNPLPPRGRKPGSVGVATGVAIAIHDEAGRELPAGERGEIVIRGPGVTPGYRANPAANEAAFREGWFRTGDQGYLDEDGYLFITGRLKELINRGGEKITPREVDEALLAHPAVAQALAFAMPHPHLGEDVAAAVVLRPGSDVTEQQLLRFAGERLAHFKVPRRVVLVDEIPKGPTGKPQRIGLFAKLESRMKPPYVAPRTPTEERLAAVWARALELPRVGVHDDFFVSGGDSLLAARVLAETFDEDVLLTTMYEAPTIEQQAKLLDARAAGRALPPSLALVHDGPARLAPVFLLPGSGPRLGKILDYLAPGRALYAVRDYADSPAAVEELAARFVEDLRTVQPAGPYALLGVCSGCARAFEMAQQLRAAGERIAALVFVDPTPPQQRAIDTYLELAHLVTRSARLRLHQPRRVAAELKAVATPGRSSFLRSKVKFLVRWWQARSYTPRPYAGAVHVFVPRAEVASGSARLEWRRLVGGGFEVHETAAGHLGMNDAQAAAAADEVNAIVERGLAPERSSAAG